MRPERSAALGFSYGAIEPVPSSTYISKDGAECIQKIPWIMSLFNKEWEHFLLISVFNKTRVLISEADAINIETTVLCNESWSI